MRLIDADALLKKLDDSIWYNVADFNEAWYAVDHVPTVEAVPVRHGHWIKKRYWSDGVGMGESYGYWYACSECDHEVRGDYGSCGDRFCSKCGARMY